MTHPIRDLLDSQDLAYIENGVYTVIPIPTEKYVNIQGARETRIVLQDKPELASVRMEAALYEVPSEVIETMKLAFSYAHMRTRAITYEIYDRENGLADVYAGSTIPWQPGTQSITPQALKINLSTFFKYIETSHDYYRSVINTNKIDTELLDLI